jgi:hypothetical protein
MTMIGVTPQNDTGSAASLCEGRLKSVCRENKRIENYNNGKVRGDRNEYLIEHVAVGHCSAGTATETRVTSLGARRN